MFALESTSVMELHATRIAELERRAVWLRRLLLVLVLVSLVRCLTGCGGAPFESTSFGASPLGGAQSSAAAQAGAASGGPSGGTGAGGSISEIPEAPGGAGEAGSSSTESAGAPPSLGFPCNTSAWQALAFASSPTSTPALALDGDASTHWQSGTPRAAGQWFELDLGAGEMLQALELHTVAVFDMPQAAALELDGKRIAAAVAAGDGVIRFRFEPEPAHIVRVVLVDGAAANWWSIDELGATCSE
jgi:hypothetical protein